MEEFVSGNIVLSYRQSESPEVYNPDFRMPDYNLGWQRRKKFEKKKDH
jgi:hypothetical protein